MGRPRFGRGRRWKPKAPESYICEDGTDITFVMVNDDNADCPDASDEPADNEGDWFLCGNYDRIPFQ